jgi:hypothetical protein
MAIRTPDAVFDHSSGRSCRRFATTPPHQRVDSESPERDHSTGANQGPPPGGSNRPRRRVCSTPQNADSAGTEDVYHPDGDSLWPPVRTGLRGFRSGWIPAIYWLPSAPLIVRIRSTTASTSRHSRRGPKDGQLETRTLGNLDHGEPLRARTSVNRPRRRRQRRGDGGGKHNVIISCRRGWWN